MKFLPEKGYHELFRIGILVKAANGIIEAVVGIFLYFADVSQPFRAFFRSFSFRYFLRIRTFCGVISTSSSSLM